MGKTSDIGVNSSLKGLFEETAVGALVLFGGNTIATMLSAICGILVARFLGPELYGSYSLAFTVVGFLSILTGLGINLALTRYIAYYSAQGDFPRVIYLIKTGLSFIFLESIAVLFVSLVFLKDITVFLVNREVLVEPTKVLLPMLVSQAVFFGATSILIGFNDAKRAALSSIVLQLLRLLLAPLLVVLGYGLFGSLLGNTIAYLVGGLVSLFYVYLYYRKLVSSSGYNYIPWNKLLLEMFHFGLPLYSSSIVSIVVDVYRNSLLSRLVDNFVIGNFNVALRFIVVITLFMAPISTMLFPAFSKLSNNIQELKKLFTLSIKYTAILIIPITLFTIIMSREIIYIFFGRRYTLAPGYYSIVALNYLYIGLGYTILNNLFSGIGKPRVNLYMSIIYAIVFIGSTFLLYIIGSLSVSTILYLLLLATGISTAYGFIILRRDYRVHIDTRSILGIYSSSLLALIPVYVLSSLILGDGLLLNILKIVVGGSIYLAIYVTLLPILGGLGLNDIGTFSELFSRIKPLKILIDLLLGYQVRLIKIIHREFN
ncbi:MAG: oligosaccharide flippase family protein [Desulfurococcaceae archaeon]